MKIWQTVKGSWYWRLDVPSARAHGPFEIEALALKHYVFVMKGHMT
jgi:hypothetical protein